MKTVLSILTAAAVFSHALFGCCWHSDHQAFEHGSVALVDVTDCDDHHEPSSHGCLSEDRPSEDQHQHPAGPAHHHCAGGFTWIPSGKIQLDNDLAAMPIHCVAILPAILDGTVGGHADYLAAGRLQQAPPLRRHLLLQVLLT